MKKLFLSFAILFAASTVLVSCGDDKEDGSSDATETAAAGEGEGEGEGAATGRKSFCECVQILESQMKAGEDNNENPPKGCEWMDKEPPSKEAEEAVLAEAQKNCPELLNKYMTLDIEDMDLEDMDLEDMDHMNVDMDMDMQ